MVLLLNSTIVSNTSLYAMI